MKNVLIAILIVMAFAGYVWAQAAAAELRFVGIDDKEKQIKPVDLAKLKRVTVKASAHGTAGTFEGWSLGEVLAAAGVEFGEKLRGARLASYLLVEAADGYQVIFALPELDPAFTEKQVIIADRRDGKALAKEEGPYRIVVPDEKRPARWARQVTTLRIVNAATTTKDKSESENVSSDGDPNSMPPTPKGTTQLVLIPPTTTPPSASKRPSSAGRTYFKGPKGGCYYINGTGKKTYVDHSYCN